MTTQAQMFPLSEEERIARIRTGLAKDEEKAKTKRDTALAALDEATESWTMASAMLTTFDEMTGVVAACRAALAVPEGVDAETGEIMPAAEAAAEPVTPDEPISADTAVLVGWPGNGFLETVEVGANTRFGELVARYLTSLDPEDPHKNDDLNEYGVFETETKLLRPLKTVIQEADYGREFEVVPVSAD